MAHPRGVKRTGFGVFMKACWNETIEKEPFQLNGNSFEKFHHQCSVWWYNLSPQEISQFEPIAQSANKQNNEITEAYNSNVTGLPTFDSQFSDISHVLNYTNKAENSVKSMMNNSEQSKSNMPHKTLSNRNKKYPSNYDKSTLLKSKALASKTKDPQNNIKPKFTLPSKILSLAQNISGETFKSCEDIAERIVKQIGVVGENKNEKEGATLQVNKFAKSDEGQFSEKDTLHPLEYGTEGDESDNEQQTTVKSQIGQTFIQKNCKEVADSIVKQIGLVSKKKLSKDGSKIKCVYCEAVLDETDLNNHLQDVHKNYFFKLEKFFPQVKQNIKEGTEGCEPTGEHQFSADVFIEESTSGSKPKVKTDMD